jgi:hypothetical protein
MYDAREHMVEQIDQTLGVSRDHLSLLAPKDSIPKTENGRFNVVIWLASPQGSLIMRERVPTIEGGLYAFSTIALRIKLTNASYEIAPWN